MLPRRFFVKVFDPSPRTFRTAADPDSARVRCQKGLTANLRNSGTSLFTSLLSFVFLRFESFYFVVHPTEFDENLSESEDHNLSTRGVYDFSRTLCAN